MQTKIIPVSIVNTVIIPDQTGQYSVTVMYSTDESGLNANVSFGGRLMGAVTKSPNGFTTSIHVLVPDTEDTIALRTSLENIAKVI